MTSTGHLIHGTIDGYKNHGCRCPACRHTWADYHNWYMQVRAARLGPCTIPGCERGQHAKGLCRPHYERQRTTGTANADKPIAESTVRDGELRCASCLNWLPDTEFHRSSRETARRCRHRECRVCATESRRLYREAHKVPCSHGCGTLVNHERRNKDKPPECRACYDRRCRAERAAA